MQYIYKLHIIRYILSDRIYKYLTEKIQPVINSHYYQIFPQYILRIRYSTRTHYETATVNVNENR